MEIKIKICFETRSARNKASSPAQDVVRNNWEFTEVWIDPMLLPPYVLLLLSDSHGNCQIYDPSQSYKIVFSSDSYDQLTSCTILNQPDIPPRT